MNTNQVIWMIKFFVSHLNACVEYLFAMKFMYAYFCLFSKDKDIHLINILI